MRFHIKTISNNPEKTSFFEIKVNTKSNGRWTESAKWSTFNEIGQFKEVKISWADTDYDSLRVLMLGGARNGPDDGCYDTSDSWVDGISLDVLSAQAEPLEASFTFYPNPAHQKLFLQLNDAQLIAVRLYNQDGMLVLSSKKQQLDVSSLSTGVYLVEAETDRGLFIRKLAVQ